MGPAKPATRHARLVWITLYALHALLATLMAPTHIMAFAMPAVLDAHRALAQWLARPASKAIFSAVLFVTLALCTALPAQSEDAQVVKLVTQY